MNKNQIRKMQLKILVDRSVLILFATSVNAHPDGPTSILVSNNIPLWFCSGLLGNCRTESISCRGNKPDDIRAVCGCVVDAIRHSMPFH